MAVRVILPTFLLGISWGNENFCLNLFQQSSAGG